MFLPSGEIILTDGKGKEESTMIVDLNNIEDFKNEVKYLFNKCGYNREKYFEALYKNKNNRITMRFLIEDLED